MPNCVCLDGLWVDDDAADFIGVDRMLFKKVIKKNLGPQPYVKYRKKYYFSDDSLREFIRCKDITSEGRVIDKKVASFIPMTDINGNERLGIACIHTYDSCSGERMVEFICPWCGRSHQHGGGKYFGECDGYRYSHCSSNKYSPGSYWIKEVNDPVLAGFSVHDDELSMIR